MSFDSVDSGSLRRFYDDGLVPTITADMIKRRIVGCNAAAEQLMGMPRDELLGRPPASLLVDESELSFIRTRCLDGESTRVVCDLRCASGATTVELLVQGADPDGIAHVQAIELQGLLAVKADLERTVRQLTEQNERLETFAGRVAHDLRGPLATAAGFVDLLADRDDLTDDERTGVRERCRATLHTLHDMVVQMVGDAGIGMARAAVSSDRVTGSSVASLLAEVGAIVAAEVHDAGAILTTSTTVELLPAPAAPVRQVLVNLVGNSVKFRDPDRPLRVSVDVTGDHEHVAITIADNGRGIEGDIDALFEEGVRGANADAVPGSGFGLAFCAKAIHDLGGTIEGRTRSPGVEFRIELRDRRANAPAAIGPNSAEGLSNSQLQVLFDSSPVPMLFLDIPKRRIERVNRAAEALLQLPADQIVGRSGRDFVADQGPVDELRQILLAPSRLRPADAGRRVEVRSGDRYLPADVYVSPVEESTLALIHVVLTEPADLSEPS